MFKKLSFNAILSTNSFDLQGTFCNFPPLTLDRPLFWSLYQLLPSSKLALAINLPSIRLYSNLRKFLWACLVWNLMKHSYCKFCRCKLPPLLIKEPDLFSNFSAQIWANSIMKKNGSNFRSGVVYCLITAFCTTYMYNTMPFCHFFVN